MTILFWLAFALVAYTYLGYPLMLLLLARRPLEPAPDPAEWPEVSVVVPFCNEAARVADKLATLQALDYPKERLQIIFVADGEGDDGTGETLRRCTGVEAVVLPVRGGKAGALNAGLDLARHDHVMFSDARQAIAPDALKRMVRRICRPGIGAVSGELVQLDDDDTARISLYWRYERALRKAESRLASVPGVTGALYLIKRRHCLPLAPDTLLDDVEMPLPALRAGERIVLEDGALVYDRVAEDVARERSRKVRTLAGNVQVFMRHGWLFLPWRNPIWWQFLSHKVLRLLVPYALAMMLVLPLFIGEPLYLLLWAGQVGFYLMALGNAHAWPLCRGRLAATARLFLELNLAAVMGVWRFLRAPVDPRWEKTS